MKKKIVLIRMFQFNFTIDALLPNIQFTDSKLMNHHESKRIN